MLRFSTSKHQGSNDYSQRSIVIQRRSPSAATAGRYPLSVPPTSTKKKQERRRPRPAVHHTHHAPLGRSTHAEKNEERQCVRAYMPHPYAPRGVGLLCDTNVPRGLRRRAERGSFGRCCRRITMPAPP
ncbi:hypothetical protein MTO96_032627 [Rhipicephalus appendiculatus]